MLAQVVMDGAAALLNDTALSVFNYTVQIPYVNLALADLREELQLSNAPATNESSTEITVPALTAELDFFTTPALPSDLIEIQQIWYNNGGTYWPATRVEFLPHVLDTYQFQTIQLWSWQEPKLKFLPIVDETIIKIDYIKNMLASIGTSTDDIGILAAQSYLTYKTAALLAKYIGENPSRSDELNLMARNSLDKTIGISVKGRQSIPTRRRPFRAAYKASYGQTR